MAYRATVVVKRPGMSGGTHLRFRVIGAKGRLQEDTFAGDTMEVVPFEKGDTVVIYVKRATWRLRAVAEDRGQSVQNVALTMSTGGFMNVLLGVMTILFVAIILQNAFVMVLSIAKGDLQVGGNVGNMLQAGVMLYIALKVWKAIEKKKEERSLQHLETVKLRTGRGPDKGVESLPQQMTTQQSFRIHAAPGEQLSGDAGWRLEDDNGVLLYMLREDITDQTRILILDSEQNGAGFLKRSTASENKFIVHLEGEDGFSLVRKSEKTKNYEVSGLDYSLEIDGELAKRCKQDVGWVLRNFEGEAVAEMTAQRQDIMHWKTLRQLSVKVLPGQQNNIYIMFLAACVMVQGVGSTFQTKENQEEQEVSILDVDMDELELNHMLGRVHIR